MSFYISTFKKLCTGWNIKKSSITALVFQLFGCDGIRINSTVMCHASNEINISLSHTLKKKTLTLQNEWNCHLHLCSLPLKTHYISDVWFLKSSLVNFCINLALFFDGIQLGIIFEKSLTADLLFFKTYQVSSVWISLVNEKTNFLGKNSFSETLTMKK